MSTLKFFPVNVEVIVQNVTINDVQLQNSNSRVWPYASFVYVKLFHTETAH